MRSSTSSGTGSTQTSSPSRRSKWSAATRPVASCPTRGLPNHHGRWSASLVGLDRAAVAVEPYQLVPLLRVARTLRTRLLIADDTGLGKTAEAGIILRWLAQRHQAKRVLIVTRATPEPQRWQEEMWNKFGFRFNILKDGADSRHAVVRHPTSTSTRSRASSSFP